MTNKDEIIEKDQEIEVTPDMIEAGLDVLYESGFWPHKADADELTMREIIHSALQVRERSQSTG